MKRILEPEYMNSLAEASSYGSMDNTTANQSFVDAVLAAGGNRGRVLDIGTGPGDIPILLAHEAPKVHITALDAAEEMLELARTRVSAAGLTDRIVLRRGDAKSMPFADGEFDLVISNTILHHIPEPIDLLREARRVLGPSGILVIRDLFRPDNEAQVERLVDLHSGSSNESHRRMLEDSLHAALTLEEARAVIADAGLDAASVEMTSDRHYTIVLN